MCPMWRQIRCIAAFLFATALSVAAGAQTPAPQAGAPDVTLESLRALSEQLPHSVDSDDEVKSIDRGAADIVAQAERFVAARTTQLADLNARLGELGPAPNPGAAAENPDITRQRAALEKERNALDADIRLARLIAVDAQQRRAEALAQQRAVFEATLLERSESPLRSAFWKRAHSQWTADEARLRHLAIDLESGAATALGAAAPAKFLIGCVALVVFLTVAFGLAESGLARLLTASNLPAGQLRLSLLALLTALAYVLTAGAALSVAWDALENAGRWTTQAARLVDAAVGFGMFLAFVLGLGRSLLANGRSSWRLPRIADGWARQLAPLPWLFAFVALVAWLPLALQDVLEARLNAVITNLAPTAAFVVACVIGMALLRHPRREPDGDTVSREASEPSDRAVRRPAALALLMGLTLTLLVGLLVLVAVGYLGLARVIAGQATWAGIVLASAYVLYKFADDLWMALLSSRSSLGERMQTALGLRRQTLDQAAVLFSGVSRILICFYTVIAFLAPLGTGPRQLFQRGGKYGSGLKVGEFDLMPGPIFRFLAVLVIGFVVLHILKSWLKNSYLPQTRVESGMRGSLTTLLSFVGGIVVVTLALSALGISVNRIAWIASALSVGIGFGLQAIVQNFISGLILLAERPVKVGDWVVLGASEGDIRRINVRATEIQLGDRSTVIVPNSEFITKTVRNMTLRNAEGRALIRLPMPLTTDAEQVRDIMLGALQEHEAVLAAPAPGVTLDGIENGLLIFQAIAYVSGPRLAAGVRSELLFTILQRLQAAQVPMANSPAAPVGGAVGPSLASAEVAPSPPRPAIGTVNE